MDEWVEQLGRLSGAVGCAAISWSTGHPQHAETNAWGHNVRFDASVLSDVEKLAAAAKPSGPVMLEDMLDSKTKTTDNLEKIIRDPLLMIGHLDSHPGTTLLVFRTKSKGGWNDEDRESCRRLLQSLIKAHTMHKNLVLNKNLLDIANKAINSMAQAHIALTQDRKIFKANTLGLKLLTEGSDIRGLEEFLYFQNPEIDHEFEGKLNQIPSVNEEELSETIWNRSFPKTNGPGSYQITLQAFKLDQWRPESSLFDRFALLSISSPEQPQKPKPKLVQEFYGLTKAQSRLVCAMLDGLSVEDASKKLNVSVNTTRSHLRAIYNKLNISNKTELISLLSATLVRYHPGSGD